MKIVTVASNTSERLFKDYLLASCRYFAADLAVLGEGVTWTGFRQKDALLVEYLKTLRIDEVVLFCDAYDSLLMGGVEELRYKYEQFKEPVVFSAEKDCWPDKQLARRFPKSATAWRFLNSGGMIGRVDVLLDLLEEMGRLKLDRFGWSNQYAWIHLYLSRREIIAIDTQCEIFQTLSATGMVRELEFREGRWINRCTGTQPTHIHFNGSAKNRFLRHAYDWLPWNAEPQHRDWRQAFMLYTDDVFQVPGIRHFCSLCGAAHRRGRKILDGR